MPTNFLILTFAVFFVWLFALSIFFWRILNHYNKLSKGVSQKSLKSILEDLIKEEEVNKKLEGYLVPAVIKSLEMAKKKHLSLKEASIAIAMSNILEA